jgi:hypothetical protein
MFSMFVSVAAGVYSIYAYSRHVGWQHFLPRSVNIFLNNVSIFDILVNTFIYRQFFHTVMAVINPFLQSDTPQAARALLKSDNILSEKVQKIIFKKGIINLFG